ncbi:MAG: HNH endonuclease [Gammaproteobacteria bacterium]|nr:HNH endonuclease [Gammaproteobacteria bacterium]
MPSIFIAPADHPRERSDLDRSLINAIDRKKVITNFSDASYPELIEIERRGKGFYAWGLPNSPENVERWFHMGVGDCLLVSYKGAYHHYAKVLGRYDNARAAEAIWGHDGGERNRELLFFVTEPIPLSLPYGEVKDYFEEGYTEFTQIPEDVLDRIESDFGTVDRFVRRRFLNTGAGGPILDMSGIIQLSERDQAKLQTFDPNSSKDARSRIVDSIIRRRGYPEFRRRLLAAYEFKCAMTGCDAPDALEAAYIIPYKGKHTHHPSNGLLLRADLHTLFDLGKIAIDTRSMTLIISDDLLDTSYRILSGRPMRYPAEPEQRPSTDALDLHRRLAGL